MRKHQRAHLVVFLAAIERAVINIPRIVHSIRVLQVTVVVAQHVRDIPTGRPHPIVVGSRERLMIAKRHALLKPTLLILTLIFQPLLQRGLISPYMQADRVSGGRIPPEDVASDRVRP